MNERFLVLTAFVGVRLIDDGRIEDLRQACWRKEGS